ncbi:hypothetical protein GOODEAATRI_029485, partial [Goodea atripinnis]
VEDVSSEARRLSRCLSQASFPAESSHAEGDMREHKTIKKVEGLVDSSQISGLKPFVKIRLMLAGPKGTEVEGLKEQEVRDFDRFSRNTVLGEVRVPLGQLNITYPLELQKDLQTPQKDLVGEVLLSLKYLPTSQRLEIALLKVRTALTETSSGAGDSQT